MIDGVTPPIVEKTAQTNPGIFSLIDLRYHLDNRMGGIWKWYGHERLLFSNLFPSLLNYTSNLSVSVQIDTSNLASERVYVS
jgi:hypothetical protein